MPDDPETRVRLDVEAEAAAFRGDPAAALRGRPEPVLLDEWQDVPGILTAVRRAVDADPRPNRFYVTGSVHAEIENRVWPGTGRLVRLAIYPMSIREQLGLVGGYVSLAMRSGFPTAALELEGQARAAWLDSYIDDLLTHDIEKLEQPGGRRRDPERLQSYLEAYALNSAGVSESKTIYEAAGINKITAMSYESLLTDLLIVERVPAWTSNRLKRLVRQPKRYMVDAALMAAALRMDEQGVMGDGDILGRILDTFVASQLRPEVKATAAPGAADARHLTWLRDQLGDRFLSGIVFHTGPDLFELGHKIQAAPIASLWS